MPDAMAGRIRRPNMSDVGKRAQVSAQTVSRFFTGGYVAPATRSKIAEAIDDLGYRHNQIARNLRVQRSDTVGLIAMGPLHVGHTQLFTGASHAARAEGFSVVTSLIDIETDTRGSNEETRAAFEKLLSFQVDGILVATPYRGINELVYEIAQIVPVVVLFEQPGNQLDSTHLDSFTAGQIATEHLIALGHRRIIHLAGPSDRVEALERERGYRFAMDVVGHPPLSIVRCKEWDFASGASVGLQMDPNSFTAVIAGNDDIALGFLHSMRERGLLAPRDFSIVGVDDMPISAYSDPPLTTVRLDFRTLGETSLKMLTARIRTGEPQGAKTIGVQMVVRSSTGPVSLTRSNI